MAKPVTPEEYQDVQAVRNKIEAAAQNSMAQQTVQFLQLEIKRALDVVDQQNKDLQTLRDAIAAPLSEDYREYRENYEEAEVAWVEQLRSFHISVNEIIYALDHSQPTSILKHDTDIFKERIYNIGVAAQRLKTLQTFYTQSTTAAIEFLVQESRSNRVLGEGTEARLTTQDEIDCLQQQIANGAPCSVEGGNGQCIPLYGLTTQDVQDLLTILNTMTTVPIIAQNGEDLHHFLEESRGTRGGTGNRSCNGRQCGSDASCEIDFKEYVRLFDENFSNALKLQDKILHLEYVLHNWNVVSDQNHEEARDDTPADNEDLQRALSRVAALEYIVRDLATAGIELAAARTRITHLEMVVGQADSDRVAAKANPTTPQTNIAGGQEEITELQNELAQAILDRDAAIIERERALIGLTATQEESNQLRQGLLAQDLNPNAATVDELTTQSRLLTTRLHALTPYADSQQLAECRKIVEELRKLQAEQDQRLQGVQTADGEQSRKKIVDPEVEIQPFKNFKQDQGSEAELNSLADLQKRLEECLKSNKTIDYQSALANKDIEIQKLTSKISRLEKRPIKTKPRIDTATPGEDVNTQELVVALEEAEHLGILREKDKATFNRKIKALKDKIHGLEHKIAEEQVKFAGLFDQDLITILRSGRRTKVNNARLSQLADALEQYVAWLSERPACGPTHVEKTEDMEISHELERAKAKIAEYEKIIKALKKKSNDAQIDVAAVNTDDSDHKHFNNKIAGLEQANSILQEKLSDLANVSSIKDCNCDELRQRIEALTAENQELEHQIVRLNVVIAAIAEFAEKEKNEAALPDIIDENNPTVNDGKDLTALSPKSWPISNDTPATNNDNRSTEDQINLSSSILPSNEIPSRTPKHGKRATSSDRRDTRFTTPSSSSSSSDRSTRGQRPATRNAVTTTVITPPNHRVTKRKTVKGLLPNISPEIAPKSLKSTPSPKPEPRLTRTRRNAVSAGSGMQNVEEKQVVLKKTRGGAPKISEKPVALDAMKEVVEGEAEPTKQETRSSKRKAIVADSGPTLKKPAAKRKRHT